MTEHATGHALGPTRTCVGCRQRRPADELVRIVTIDGAIVPDLRRVQAGRGAHLCPSRACFERAVKRRSFKRSLRTNVAVDAEGLLRTLGEAFATEVDRVRARHRLGRADHARSPWLANGLREFTLTNPGAMNRGPVRGGETFRHADGARRRSGSHE